MRLMTEHSLVYYHEAIIVAYSSGEGIGLGDWEVTGSKPQIWAATFSHLLWDPGWWLQRHQYQKTKKLSTTQVPCAALVIDRCMSEDPRQWRKHPSITVFFFYVPLYTAPVFAELNPRCDWFKFPYHFSSHIPSLRVDLVCAVFMCPNIGMTASA